MFLEKRRDSSSSGARDGFRIRSKLSFSFNFLRIGLGSFLGLVLASCVLPIDFKEGPKLYNLGRLSSLTEFSSSIKNYADPKGVLPEFFFPIVREYQIKGDFLYSSSFTSHEFFIFDHKRLLIFLSLDPIYFIEIKSPLFYAHCLEETEQIRAGKSARRKLISSVPFLKDLGDLNIEIYFAPKEIYYASRGQHIGRIQQVGTQKPPMDLWRLFAAARKLKAYFPDYTDQRMHADIQEQLSKGKIRSIFTSHLDLANEGDERSLAYLKLLEKENAAPKFAYIHGEELELSQELLGGEESSIDFIDQSFLLKDFLFLFSFSPGKDLSPSNGSEDLMPALNYRDGIALLLRGNKNALEPFLAFIEKLMQGSGNNSSEHPTILISELGNQINGKAKNDYVLLHNPNDFPLSLTGLHLGRDRECNIENGWSEYKPLPAVWLESRGYFLISREGNELNADWIWSGSITEDYCIVLSSSILPPTSLDSEQVIDFVHFRDLENESAYRRKGSCQEEDSESFADDFFKIRQSSRPLSQQSGPCS